MTSPLLQSCRVQKGKELNDFQRNPLDIEILSNLRFGSLEIRDTSVTRVTNKFKLRVAGASKKAMDLKLLERVEPLLSGIIEHVFGMYDANIVIRQFRRVGVRDCEPVVPAFVELWIVPDVSPILAVDLAVTESKKSAGNSV